MPAGACDRCHSRFVIESERSPQRTCPRCLHPLRVLTREEMLRTLRSDPSPPPTKADREDRLCHHGQPLAADEFGQRLLTAIAEGAYQRGEAELRVRRAQQTRMKAARLVDEARATRETICRSREPAAVLPCLDYALPPLEEVLLVTRQRPPSTERGDEPLPGSSPIARGRKQTTLYVWGYGTSGGDLGCENWEKSEAAIRFAAAAGWDLSERDVWGLEVTLPLGLCETLRLVEARLRANPAVAGWGLRMVRVDSVETD